ncbi:KH domain-containing protein [Candidatus Microgenomates bacterium]|nr:KH domain-containing protein [Candidatus Microgenomates bacterium]
MAGNLATIQETLEKLIKLADVPAEVTGEELADGAMAFALSTENPALLIGYHGKTIAALQTLLNVIAYKKLGTTGKILVDVDGWRERREEALVSLAQNAARRARETNIPQPIYNLSPYERRVVHMALAEEVGVESESEGEGRDRHINVKVKS